MSKEKIFRTVFKHAGIYYLQKLCRFGPYLTLSVSYGPNLGFEFAVPGIEELGPKQLVLLN